MGILDKLMFFAAGKNSGNIPQNTQAVPTRKILIAEADEQLKALYTQMLQNEQYTVQTVADGATGLNTLLSFKPDIILLDLNLPVMSGKEMLHHLRALPEYVKTPVVVVSDTGDMDTIQQVKTFDGANAFLIKSTVTPQQVIETVKNTL